MISAHSIPTVQKQPGGWGSHGREGGTGYRKGEGFTVLQASFGQTSLSLAFPGQANRGRTCLSVKNTDSQISLLSSPLLSLSPFLSLFLFFLLQSSDHWGHQVS